MSGDGIVVVDKPGGWTSHDVVGKVRKLAKTRRVGHAGTLDPMATGVLVLGIGRATRLLSYLAGTSKDYAATVRLGQSTTTDDAEGEVTGGAAVDQLTEEHIRAAAADLTGDLDQVPSTVSAVKVDGKRAYARARAGENVELAARPVRVEAFDVVSFAPPTTPGPAQPESARLLDLDVRVRCSSGTYVRALARDLGHALGVGAHLTTLRRTRVGSWQLADAVTLDQLGREWVQIPIAQVAARLFATVEVDADTARLVGFGQRLPKLADASAAGIDSSRYSDEPLAVFAPDGRFLALYRRDPDTARPVAVFV